jgi:hypothetical protein
MINLEQLKGLVIEPTLKELGLYSKDASALILGTVVQESRAEYIKQLGDGPALGLCQMEVATHDDIWANFLKYKKTLSGKISAMLPNGYNKSRHLVFNLAYSAAMCRVHYLRVPKKLPKFSNSEAMGEYWKKYYNTNLGKGEASEFIEKYKKYVLPLYE